ncbi:osteopontin [Pygocentrus nattereri]|uniref:osteopontin n=1 Tax=Pygocentrus nattereri TaxID=42514 RepID=UPI00189115E1|nr:osteopontin [Pygocentrus nattereri]
MKAVMIFGLLFAVVYCRPVKRSASSSESSEEQAVAKLPLPVLDKGPADPLKAAPAQDLKAAVVAAASDEDTDDSDETEDKNTESDTEGDSADSADTQDTQDTYTDDSSESAESGETEATTVPPVTVEPTLDPIIDNGRGDSMGYPSDYKKTIIYVDANDIEKIPFPYKSNGPDKTDDLNSISMKTSHFDGQEANDVEKHLKVYKALQVHNEVLEEDTSTPEEESQGLEVASRTEDEGPSAKQASLGSEESASASDANGESASASASQEETEESDSSKSSEEATATPGAADTENDSSQSSESQEDDSAEQAMETTTDVPDVIIAK